MGRTAARTGRAAAVLVVAVAVSLLLLCAYAAPRTALPWSGAAEPLPVAGFRGGVPQPDGSLRIERAAGAARHLLRFDSSDPLRGRFLAYRFDELPATLRLVFGWRRGGRWYWVPVPFPDGRTTVDLARLSPDWPGEARTFGFLLLPAELLPAEALPPLQPTLREAVLLADARAPAVAALLDEWWAYRPWSGRSINTAGFDLRMDQPLPFQGFVLLALGAVVLVILLARLSAGRRWRGRGGTIFLATLAASWLLLDLAQLRTAWQRGSHLATLHQAADGALAVEPRLAQALRLVAARPELAGPETKLVVFAASPFLQSWPVFALHPVNAATLPVDALARLRRGALVLRLGGAGELAEGTLRSSTHAAHVRLLEQHQGLQLLELLADPEPLP